MFESAFLGFYHREIPSVSNVGLVLINARQVKGTSHGGDKGFGIFKQRLIQECLYVCSNTISTLELTIEY